MEKKMIVEVWQDRDNCRALCAVPQEGDNEDKFSEYGKSIAALQQKVLIKVFKGSDWYECMEKYHWWLEYHYQEWEQPRYRQ